MNGAETNDGRSRPTMRDVAEAAQVSLKTVSRVVNDEPGVGSETAARVRDAIVELGFRRNDVARSLRPGQRASLVGLIIADITNPFYSAISRAVEDVARRNGCGLIMAHTDEDPQRERAIIEELETRRVAGLMIVPASSDHGYLQDGLDAGTRMVFIDRPPVNLKADHVLIDNFGGAKAGVEHLVREGHVRIGLVGDDPKIYTAGVRVDGYRAALQETGRGVDEGLVLLGSHDVGAAERAAASLLARPDPPTALFTTNNRNTIGALRAIRDHGRPVGLVGFDDFELADMLDLPLTVVAFDSGELGRIAAKLLFEKSPAEGGGARSVVVSTRIVQRGRREAR